MSSSVTDGAILAGKVLVHIAESGRSFDLECDGDTLVEAVMQFIESVSGISFNDQLVLCLDMKLEPQRPLSAYKLPSDDPDREVFIFNKLLLQNNSAPPTPEQVDIIEIIQPPIPSLAENPHPLDDAPDPALKALPEYERRFRCHYQRGYVIYSRTQARIQACERLLREQKVQERALDVARSNLEHYYRVINQNYLDFMKRFSQQHRIHSDLVENFGRDIDRLRSIKLHPSLQTNTRKCLLDFVKEENLRKVAENCSNSHRQFENKVSQFKQMFGEVKRKVEDLFSCRAPSNVRNLELTIKEHYRYITEQKSIMQSLSKDVSTVKKFVDDCISCQLSSSLRPHDAVSALGPMYEVHDKNHLPNMQACDNSIAKLLEFCQDKKNEMNSFVHSYMQRITYVSFTIKDVKLQFPVFKEAMTWQDDLFLDLRLVRGIGPAYRACLAEVVRRKASMKLYMGMAGQLAERLATKREAEVRRREEFLKAQSSYLPKDILAAMGLYDMPNQCDVNIAPFDISLLDIDISDIDRYAPEYLGAILPRGEKPGDLKGSSPMSNDSSHSAHFEEFTGETLQISEELPESSELVEITGTSKIEVENAKLKAELASALAMICSLRHEVEFESLDDGDRDMLKKTVAEKTAEALHLKDEYGKHLESLFQIKQVQCYSYEKRIQELEQKLSDQYSHEQKLSTCKDVYNFSSLEAGGDQCKADPLGDGEVQMPCSESMDDVSCISSLLNAKLGTFNTQSGKAREGGDENMMDSSGVVHPQLDSSMQDPHREEIHGQDRDGSDKITGQLGMSSINSGASESIHETPNALSSDPAAKTSFISKASDEILSDLQNVLSDKSNQLAETEVKLKTAREEVAILRRELEVRQKMLDESQMNCAHLENCLHEAREEARPICVLLIGELQSGVSGFADSLRALAQSLSNSASDNEDDGTVEFRKCIRVLAERVSFLSRNREELLDKFPKLEDANEQLRKDLEEKEEMVKTLYKKHQLEKQASKEKISFRRFEVHEIAAFVLNPAGHYEAINRNCLNYYLSSESVALFVDHLPTRPRTDPVDQLTSDEENNRLTLNSGSAVNPYGLPIDCEYYVVTVAMLPDANHSATAS
ncbi:hypothetical protein MLD38_014932 [Melastoma candidum]|uniref:Uncharacterized protein n=1 Tax=Melastoma candidum TaxID=119954 RepID=A0ACB9RMV2_9MYRT|nr:hypothetical protein MLD38_014932 [Melastoma candidum]